MAGGAVAGARTSVCSIVVRFAFVNCHLLFDFRLSRRLQSTTTHTSCIVLLLLWFNVLLWFVVILGSGATKETRRRRKM